MNTTQLADLATIAESLRARGNALIEESKQIEELLRDAGWHANGKNGNGNGHHPAPVPVPSAPLELGEPERTVGTKGAVTKDIAFRAARVLGDFSRNEFEERIGHQRSKAAATRWLALFVKEGVLEYSAGRYHCTVKPPVEDWVIDREEPFSPQEAADACGIEPEEAVERLEALRGRSVVEFATVEGVSGLYQYKPVERGTWPPVHPHKTPPERDRPAYDMAPVRGEPVRRSAASKVTRRQRSTEGAGGIKGHKQRDRRYNEMQKAKEARAAEQSAKDKAKFQPKGGRKKRGSIPVT